MAEGQHVNVFFLYRLSKTPLHFPVRPTAFVSASDGTQLPYYIKGEGTPFFLFNGFSCFQANLKYAIADLSEQHKVISWDYKGHGAAETASDLTHVNVDAFIDDARRVLDATKTDKTLLFGYSMGTQLMLEFAHRHPDRILGMVSLNGITGRVLDTFLNTKAFGLVFPALKLGVARLGKVSDALWRNMNNTPFDLRMFLGKQFFIDGDRVKDEDMRPFLNELQNLDPAMLVHLINEIHEHSCEAALPGLDKPALFLSGDKDNFAPTRCSEEAVAAMPDARLVVIPGGTHNANLEQPEFIAREISDFVAERSLAIEPTATAQDKSYQ